MIILRQDGSQIAKCDRRSLSKSKASREIGVPKADILTPNAKRDRRSLFKSKASREVGVPKAEIFQPKRSGTEEARPSSRRLGKQEYLRRKQSRMGPEQPSMFKMSMEVRVPNVETALFEG